MFYKTVEKIIVLLIVINGFLIVSIYAREDDRIVGGKDVPIENFPHQVSLQYNNNHFCGGSILSNTIILTAAHCVDTFKLTDLPYLTVNLGSSMLNSTGVQIPFQSFAKHQLYDKTNLNYDAAIIKIKSPVTFKNSIKPISLATTNPKEGAHVFVTGWGVRNNNDTESSNKLQGAQLNFIPRKACGSFPNRYSSEMITSTMICAAAIQKGSCRGDSGGPLIDINSNHLLGIVSWGAICAEKNSPGVYTSVPALRRWIINSANILSRTL